MNPLFVVPLLVYTLAAALWPAQVDGRRRGAPLLLVEAAVVIVALTVGTFLSPLVVPRAQGLFWGRVGLLATGPRPQATTHATSGKRKWTSCRISHTGRAVVRSAWNSSPRVTAKRAARAARQRRLNCGIASRSARCRRARRGGGRARDAAASPMSAM